MDISIGPTLTMLRKNKKLMQKGLAAELAEYGFTVASKTIYNWEKGLSQPSIPQFLALCDILDVDDVLWQFAAIDRGPYAGLNSDGRRKARDLINLLHHIDMYKLPQSDTHAQSFIPIINDTGTAAANPIKSPDTDYSVNSPGPMQPDNTIDPINPVYTDTDTVDDSDSDDSGFHVLPRVLRLYDIPVSAGTGNFLEDSGFEEIEVPSYVPPSVNYALRLSGDSMEPLLTDGQVIWVKHQDVLEGGEIGIFAYADNVFCKKLITDGKRAFLRSLNPLYSDIEIKEDYGFKVLGKVLC